MTHDRRSNPLARLGVVGGKSGFSLIELMVTLSILAILLAIAAPSFYEASLNSKISGYANELKASAQLARSEAIKRNISVKLCVSSNATSCGTGNWNTGWVVLAGTSVLSTHSAATQGVQINSTANEIVFQPSGLTATTATLTICRKTPTVGTTERVVTISANGRSAITKTSSGICT